MLYNDTCFNRHLNVVKIQRLLKTEEHMQGDKHIVTLVGQTAGEECLAVERTEENECPNKKRKSLTKVSNVGQYSYKWRSCQWF